MISKRGWFKDSYRHSLAAKGIKTNRYYARRFPGRVFRGVPATTTAFGRAIEAGTQRYSDLGRARDERQIILAQTGVLGSAEAQRQIDFATSMRRPLSELEEQAVKQRISSAEEQAAASRLLTRSESYKLWTKEEHGILNLNKMQQQLEDFDQIIEREEDPARLKILVREMNRLKSEIEDQQVIIEEYGEPGQAEDAPALIKKKMSEQVLKDKSVRMGLQNIERADRRAQKRLSREIMQGDV